MGESSTQQSVVFKDLFGRPVVARFDQPDSSSDGGAPLLLKACDERLRLTRAMAGCVRDPRQQSIDRTSCTSFWTNQLRELLTAAAYVLMQELRLRAQRTGCASAQVTTLRERLFKVGAWWLERSVRRIVIHLPEQTAWRAEWCRLARAVGVVSS